VVTDVSEARMSLAELAKQAEVLEAEYHATVPTTGVCRDCFWYWKKNKTCTMGNHTGQQVKPDSFTCKNFLFHTED
jgi:hypothetical protein